MSNKKHTNSEIIVQRLLLATECSTKTQLAEKLGYNSVSGVTNWKSRGVDWNKIIENFPTLNVNYLKTGVGEIFDSRSQNPSVEEPLSEYSLNLALDKVSLIEQLTDDDKVEKLPVDDPLKLIESAELLLRLARLALDKK